jgi:hypothetical protein
MEEKNYNVIDVETDEIVNTIVWNGVDLYELDARYRLVEYVAPEPLITEVTIDPANTTPQGVSVFE